MALAQTVVTPFIPSPAIALGFFVGVELTIGEQDRYQLHLEA